MGHPGQSVTWLAEVNRRHCPVLHMAFYSQWRPLLPMWGITPALELHPEWG